MISNEWFVADFETTGEEYYNEHGYTKVWLWAICDKDANIVAHGSDIASFIKECRKYYGKTIYFHNLKFDGIFILSYLFSINEQYKEDLKGADRGFTTLIGDMGEFYSIDYRIAKNKTIHFVDSLKLLPFSEKKIAKDFDLPILKGSIDYHDYVINDTTLEYIYNDVKIVAMALKELKAEGINKMTIASSAFNYYKSNKDMDYFMYCFPELDNDFLDKIRPAYRGGRSQVSPLHESKIVRNVKRYDINSMYPYILRNKPLPYGLPIELDDKTRGTYRFEIYHVRIEFFLKDKSFPSLLKKTALYNMDDSYYINSNGILDIWITNLDLQLVYRNYDVSYIEYLESYGFKTTKILFIDYVDKWYGRKLVDKNAKKVIDKLMLNSLYGKFGTDYKRCKKIPYIKEDGSIGYNKSKVEEGKKYYLPLSIAVCSWAHIIIDDAIHATGFENFIYCDTDSVHTLGDLPKEWIDQKELGKFKLESIEEKARYVRQKCYITLDNGTYNVTCAGMPDNCKKKFIEDSLNNNKDPIKEFKVGLEVNGKLLPKKVKGGVILRETTFKIN